ncbi:MAG: hypothetical protein WB729_06735 [Candidatus Sulfotelmatobacter sp.]
MALISTKRSKLPSVGKPLDVYYATDSKEVFLAAGDGTLLNCRDILQGVSHPARAVGPQGQPGRDGARGAEGKQGLEGRAGRDSTVPGPKGEKGDRGSYGLPGLSGKEGKDGKDSAVPGPRGPEGAKGDRGEKGERGDLTVVGDAELLAAVEKLRAQKANLQSRIITTLKDMGDHPVYQIARQYLQNILKETQG